MFPDARGDRPVNRLGQPSENDADDGGEDEARLRSSASQPELRAPSVLSNERAHGRTTVSIASQGDRVAACSRPARDLRSTR